MHERVDEGGSEHRRTMRVATSLRLVSHILGVSGIADMVEFHLTENEYDGSGRRIATNLKGWSGFWRPFPVEYKHGKPKSHQADEVQLCAQAICLEEMLDLFIPSGALFYGEPRRRTIVVFDDALRQLTKDTADGLHSLIDNEITPPPVFGKWCKSCSIVEVCRPDLFVSKQSARKWLEQNIDSIEL